MPNIKDEKETTSIIDKDENKNVETIKNDSETLQSNNNTSDDLNRIISDFDKKIQDLDNKINIKMLEQINKVLLNIKDYSKKEENKKPKELPIW